MHIHVHIHDDSRSSVLEDILESLEQIERRLKHMANEMDDLAVEITEIEGAGDSTIALVEAFYAYVQAHLNDPAALRTYVERLRAQKAELAAAVVANPLPPETP